MIPTKITIEKIDNGYIVSYEDQYADSDDKFISKQVIAVQERIPITHESEQLSECAAMRELIWAIFDKLDFSTSDHNYYNLFPIIKRSHDDREIEASGYIKYKEEPNGKDKRDSEDEKE